MPRIPSAHSTTPVALAVGGHRKPVELQAGAHMLSISKLDQHPENRKKRFPQHLWPSDDLDQQSVDEWWVFLEFIQSAGFNLEGAPTKLTPPGPDIECTLVGGKRFFELAEILESSLAAGLNHSGKEAQRKSDAVSRGDIEAAESIKTWGCQSFSANGSLVRILTKKLGKSYLHDGAPCDLLLYYFHQAPLGPFEYLMKIDADLEPLLADCSFDNIWFFSLWSAQVMGKVRLAEGGKLQVVFDQQFSFDKSAPFLALAPGSGDTPDRVQLFEPELSPIRIPKK
jgi:hypothetical protein